MIIITQFIPIKNPFSSCAKKWIKWSSLLMLNLCSNIFCVNEKHVIVDKTLLVRFSWIPILECIHCICELHCNLASPQPPVTMKTSSNGNTSALLAFCEGNPPVTGGIPSQRPVSRSLDDCIQSKPRWFEPPSHSLWHHCNDCCFIIFQIYVCVLFITALN